VLSKRVFDVVCASAGLILLMPLFIAIAIAIRLDSPGPVFFRQERVGKDGKLFRIFKFRTMRVDSEAMGQLTVGQDERITRAGLVLRHYKIDELPQLLNVMRGEMSLVGPRPEVPRYVTHYPAAVRTAVLSVPPGITEWASIRFKDENAMLAAALDPDKKYVEEVLPIKLAYYLRYVNERNLIMDLKIIFATLSEIFSRARRSDVE
jgi:lipopolysaccharide/colanic/teichoic acid biosynthesis glycosyltransferase